MEDFPLTALIAWLALVLAAWSLKASFDANRLSEKANETGEKALEHSKNTSRESLRPRIQLKPAVKESVALTYLLENGRITFLPNINIKNVGLSPATKIKCNRDNMKLITPWDEYDAGSSEAPGVASSLSPGQDFHLSRPLSMKPPSEILNEALRAWENDDIYVLVEVELEYSDSEASNSYSVSGEYKLSKNRDVIVDYVDS